MIQIPITINTDEIEKAILNKIPSPLSSGITEKIGADIMAAKKISTYEYKKSFRTLNGNFFKPFESSYKYVSKDITDMIDATCKVGMWLEHKVYLTNLDILFDGTSVKIFTSYKIDLDLDYEQNFFPFTKAMKVKGLLDGVVEANINFVGEIFINEKAKLQIQLSKNETEVNFTKILLPSLVDMLQLLEITHTEDILTKKLLEEPVHKYVFQEVKEHISKKHIDIELAQKIQTLVQNNATPLALSEDVWLIPEAKQISISQVKGEGNICKNTLTINIGVIAKPELITSATKPVLSPAKPIPIVCEDLSPKVYLYPSIRIKYKFVEKVIEKNLQDLIHKQHRNTKYSIANVKIYPSDTRLVIAMDLIGKKGTKKIATVYLSGIPTVNREKKHISLEDFHYTLESRNFLIHIADWMLDEKIKNLIYEKAIFTYKEKFLELSSNLSSIKHISGKKMMRGKIEHMRIENIFTSKDAIKVHILATGTMSYQID